MLYTDGPIPGRPDLFLLEPSRSHSFKWEWKTQRTLRSDVLRCQLPVVSTLGMTPYTAQGLTAEWVLLHVARSSRESISSWWYKLYVGASRARHASRLGLHGNGEVPPEFLKALLVGPEPHVLAELGRLRDRAGVTRVKVKAIAAAIIARLRQCVYVAGPCLGGTVFLQRALSPLIGELSFRRCAYRRYAGWPAPGASLAAWRREKGVQGAQRSGTVAARPRLGLRFI